MGVVNNILSGVIFAPLVFLMAAVSLSSLQRGLEWVMATSKNTSLRGYMREYVKPVCKNLAALFDRILGGSKITITPTNVLLMAVVIMLFALTMQVGEASTSDKKEKKSSSKDKDKKN